MENFTYCVPTKIIFGSKTENNVGQEVRNVAKKVLLHYGGGSIKNSGLYQRIVESLNNSGVEFIELGGVQPNPRLSLVREGVELCKKNNVDFVLAVGGGSVIDSSKAIAIGCVNDCDIWEEFFLKKKPVEKSLPVGVVLTLAAAGSESSNGTVLSDEVNQRKVSAKGQVVVPKFAILNPELTTTLPSFQTACGSADMLSHIMERYFTSSEHVDLTDRLCEAAMQTVIENAPLAIASPLNYNYRAELMLTGMIAHNNSLGIGRIQDWACHGLEHELSAIWDVAHGEGLAILTPAWMEYVYEYNIPRFVRFAEKVCNIYVGTDEDKIKGAINFLRDWYKSLGLKIRLTEYDFFDESKIEYMAEQCFGLMPRGAIKKLNAEDGVKIYRLAL